MKAQLELPDRDELEWEGLSVEFDDEPWNGSITVEARDGSSVTLGWDQFAGYAHVSWRDGDVVRLVLERYTAVLISVRLERGRTRFRVLSAKQDVEGELVVEIGETVSVRDSIVQTN